MSGLWLKMKLFVSSVWAFIQPTVMILMTEAGQRLKNIALEAVLEVAKDPMGVLKDDAARHKAFDIVMVDLKKEGIEFGNSMINTAIELALRSLKASGKVQ